MKLVLKIISYIGLGLSIIPAVLVFGEQMDSSTCKQLMFLGTVLWFVTAPTWMISKETPSED
jgi:EamA domain-containing membrane protein RarD